MITADVHHTAGGSPEAKTVEVVIPAVLHGDDITRVVITFTEKSFKVRSADVHAAANHAAVHLQYWVLYASDEWSHFS